MLDVAREAGVSKNTVSLALRKDSQIPRQTQERIVGIAERLGYQKNPTVGHLMAQLRAGATRGHRANLAILNANEDPDAFRAHPTIPRYVEGCRRRAVQQGYSLDEFWLGDPQLDGDKLGRILHSRGIRGALVIGLMNHNRLPECFRSLWENFACVVTGVRTEHPALSFACTDHHVLALRATENALRLGYRRPALVLDAHIDQLIEGRFTAGFQIAQRQLPLVRRLRPFYDDPIAPRRERAFQTWFDRERPDVILTLYHVVHTWLKKLGVRVPADVGLIQLEWRADHPRWAGMNQHNDIVGEAAVEMLISMVHNGERGVPAAPRATLIGSNWVDGTTVQARGEGPPPDEDLPPAAVPNSKSREKLTEKSVVGEFADATRR